MDTVALSAFSSGAAGCFPRRSSNIPLYRFSPSFVRSEFHTGRFHTVPNPNFRISALSVTEKSRGAVIGASQSLNFSKYQGVGNDFILVDNRSSTEPMITAEQAVELCDRHFGVGADGVIFAMPGTQGGDYTMRIFNSDGSEPEMCGNGMRCFAKFISTFDGLNDKKSFTIYTGAGLIIPEIQQDGMVRVDMGEPVLRGADVPTKLPCNSGQSVIKAELNVDGLIWGVTAVGMGNPHCVTFGTKDLQDLEVDEINLAEIGPKFENHLMFPARTNTEFVQVVSPSLLKMCVWERGAGATLACGTGACAVVVAAVLEGRAQRCCTVELPGGRLEVEWREDDNRVYLTGPALPVFHGTLPCL